MPDVAGLVLRGVEDDAAGRCRVLRTVEEIEADARRVPTEDGEVCPVPSQVGAEGKRNTGPDRLNLAQREQTLEFVELFDPIGFWRHASSKGNSRTACRPQERFVSCSLGPLLSIFR